jgi:pimeloyl-ACP methyl ester carboxylesterase
MTALTYRGHDNWLLHATIIETASEAAVPETLPLLLMHGGGPDHHSLIPLARAIGDAYTIVLPDVRGYGRSVCDDPSRHTWARYVDDVIALLDHLGFRRAIVGGAGLGATITLRAAVAHPDRVAAAILISVEDIEDDSAKAAEIAFMDAFAARVRTAGIEAAWEPILESLAPIIGTMVRDAIPRSDPASIAAAAAIGRDRSFRTVDELAVIQAPTLIIPGMDERHPTALAHELARLLPAAELATVALSPDQETLEAFARAFAPSIRDFLTRLRSRSRAPVSGSRRSDRP